ncbi:hypothetical protein [Kordia jejudonensis]|uniref:hypothetical protein n=1 Tax=Kordia jejudonensis TaxID=1348245 RepID=UPI00138DD42D|nr:hypothetical protein [Kordia jejudonensis]
MATVGYFLVTPRMYDLNFKIDVSITTVIFTICIPMLIFILLRRFKMIDSIFLKEVSQRKVPLYIYILILFLIITKVITKSIFAELFDFYLATLISSVICLMLVFFRIKASMHMMGISGLVMFLVVLSISYQVNITFALSILIFMIGLVATSRLFLKAHTFTELVIGFFIGWIPQLLVTYW